jgi:cell division protein FtsI/penicillin-binding protein 2
MKEYLGNRVLVFAGLVILFAVIMLSRLYYLQVIHGAYFKDRADRQYVHTKSGVFNRGDIYFSEKNGNLVSAATLKTGYTLAINPKLLTNPEDAYNKINPIYELDEKVFLDKASKKTDPYEELGKRLSSDVGEKIASLKIPGVILEKDRWRYYPGGSLASNAVGFVAFKDSDLSGRYGVEKYYNDILSRDDKGVYTNFFTEIFLKIQKGIEDDNLGGEGDIVLTIEPTVEEYLERTLSAVNKEYSGELAGGIIMDPKNGEIVAMAVNPSFDLNKFQEEKNSGIYNNPLVDSSYEMGSIIKPLTMASGLDAKVVTPETTYNDKGFIVLNEAKISNFDHKGRGVVPMQEVLSQSLNTGVAFVESKLGNKKFAEYMRNFGMGEETGIDLPAEASGLINNLNSPRDVEYATASFGQGVSLTPIQTIRALSALSNGGYLVTPHLVKTINYTVGVNRDVTFDKGRQVITPETSATISRMLTVVVDKAMLHGKIKQDRYSVAAKTGTAQMARPDGKGYYDDRYLHSFFGYFPAQNPRYIVFMYIVYPKGVQFASETLAMPFSKVSQFLINYYQIPPDR